MYNLADGIAHITDFVTPIVDPWLELEIALRVNQLGSISTHRENTYYGL